MFKKKKQVETVNNVMLTEKEVLQKLDIPNFRHMSKDKVMTFCSLLPNMDNGVIRSAFEKFPDFVKMACEVMSCYKQMVTSVVKKNSDNLKSFNEMSDQIITTLNALVQQKRIKRKERKYIIDSMMQLLQMKADADAKNKEWLSKLVTVISSVATSIVAIAAAILGVSVSLKK